MAIPGGGPLSISTIRGEFGGAVPDGISEYYEGGPHVPPEAAGNIPTSGPISWSDFRDSANITPNPFAIGEDMFNYNFVGSVTTGTILGGIRPVEGLIVTPATGRGNVVDETYNFDALNDYGNFKVDWAMEFPTAEYGWTYGRVYVYKNDEVVYLGQLGTGPTNPWTQDSWNRDYAGLRERTSTEFQLGFGDSIRFVMLAGTRTSSDPLRHILFRARLYRSS